MEREGRRVGLTPSLVFNLSREPVRANLFHTHKQEELTHHLKSLEHRNLNTLKALAHRLFDSQQLFRVLLVFCFLFEVKKNKNN